MAEIPATDAPVTVTPTGATDDTTLGRIQQRGSLRCGISGVSRLLNVIDGNTGFNKDLVRFFRRFSFGILSYFSLWLKC